MNDLAVTLHPGRRPAPPARSRAAPLGARGRTCGSSYGAGRSSVRRGGQEVARRRFGLVRRRAPDRLLDGRLRGRDGGGGPVRQCPRRAPAADRAGVRTRDLRHDRLQQGGAQLGRAGVDSRAVRRPGLTYTGPSTPRRVAAPTTASRIFSKEVPLRSSQPGRNFK